MGRAPLFQRPDDFLGLPFPPIFSSSHVFFHALPFLPFHARRYFAAPAKVDWMVSSSVSGACLIRQWGYSWRTHIQVSDGWILQQWRQFLTHSPPPFKTLSFLWWRCWLWEVLPILTFYHLLAKRRKPRSLIFGACFVSKSDSKRIDRHTTKQNFWILLNLQGPILSLLIVHCAKGVSKRYRHYTL